MPRVIEPGCVKCGACTADCPVEAIREGETQFYVDPAVCIDCGECHCPFGHMGKIPFVPKAGRKSSIFVPIPDPRQKGV